MTLISLSHQEILVSYGVEKEEQITIKLGYLKQYLNIGSKIGYTVCVSSHTI